MGKVKKLNNGKPGSTYNLLEILDYIQDVVTKHADSGISFSFIFSYDTGSHIATEEKFWWREDEDEGGFLNKEHLIAELDRVRIMLQMYLIGSAIDLDEDNEKNS